MSRTYSLSGRRGQQTLSPSQRSQGGRRGGPPARLYLRDYITEPTQSRWPPRRTSWPSTHLNYNHRALNYNQVAAEADLLLVEVLAVHLDAPAREHVHELAAHRDRAVTRDVGEVVDARRALAVELRNGYLREARREDEPFRRVPRAKGELAIRCTRCSAAATQPGSRPTAPRRRATSPRAPRAPRGARRRGGGGCAAAPRRAAFVRRASPACRPAPRRSGGAPAILGRW